MSKSKKSKVIYRKGQTGLEKKSDSNTISADVFQGQSNLTGDFPTGQPLLMYTGEQNYPELKSKQLEPFKISTPNLDFSRNINVSGPGEKDYEPEMDYYGLSNFGLGMLSTGLNYNQDLKNKEQLYTSIQNRNSKPLYDYNYMYGRTTSGGAEFQPVIKAEMGANIKPRYNTPYAPNNVEIEGGEYIQLPDMTGEIAYGPSHAEGGIQTILPGDTRVYSNYLKPEGSNKTFAQIAKKYDNTEYDKILNNKFSKKVDKETASIMKDRNQRELDKLFQDQQRMNGNSNGEIEAKYGASINNPGFKSLPKAVQEKIIANMEYGGYNLPELQNGDWYSEADWNKAVESQGKITGYGKAKTDPGNVTPTGKKNTFAARNQNLKEYLQSWEDVIPGISTNMEEGEAQSAIYEWSLKNNPDTIKQMWSNFGLTAKGMKNEKLRSLTSDKSGKFDPKTLDNPEVLQQLKDAYVDNYFGVRQLEKQPKPAEPIVPSTTTPKKEEPKKEEEPKTPDTQFTPAKGVKPNPYKRMPFPIEQAVPNIYGLAQAQEVFPYAIPELDSQYIRPQTLNIQSELQDIDNMGQAAIRAGADPLASYIAGMDAKQKAFQTKQNYDAEGRSRADMFNAQSKMQTDNFNAQMFDRVYNTQIANARDAQSYEKQAALQNLVDKYSKYNADERMKEVGMPIVASSMKFNQDTGMLEVDPRMVQDFNFDYIQNQLANVTNESNKANQSKKTTKGKKR